jgi:chromosome partitioning protein
VDEGEIPVSRVLAIANIKGGVGKTTTTANLAAALTERGKSVLALDLDPQASLTYALGIRPEALSTTICDALSGLGRPIAAIAQPTESGIDLVPASHDLMQVAEYLESTHVGVTLLRAALEPLRDCYDYVMIDCPASAGILMAMALTAADQVLIPLIPNSLSLHALNWLLYIINQVHDNWNPTLRTAGLVLTMYDPRTRHARDIIETVHQLYGAEIPFFNAVIKDSVRLSEAALAGKSILAFAPESQPARAYRVLADEVEKGIAETPANELASVLVRGYEALRQRDLQTAFAAFCQATEINPQFVQAWVSRGESALAWDESVRCLARALELDPQLQEAQSKLEGRLKERVSNAVSADIPEMIALAQNLEQHNLTNYAQQLFRRVTELDPQHEEAWLGLARTMSHPKDAAAHIRRCLEIHPDSALAESAMAAVQERLKDEAKKMIEAGGAMLLNGQRADAHAAFLQAINLDPQNDSGWVGCARSAESRRAGTDYAKHAVQINPDNADARQLSVDQPVSDLGKAKPVSSRWRALARYLVPAAITVAALVFLLIKSTAW